MYILDVAPIGAVSAILGLILALVAVIVAAIVGIFRIKKKQTDA